jgi:RNA polymerase sigma-70 factor (ECF subfamily)
MCRSSLVHSYSVGRPGQTWIGNGVWYISEGVVMAMSGAEMALLERAREGDEQALEALLAAAQPQLYRFSMRMCRQTEDAEDVLQDSMMSLARSVRDFRGASSLSTWIFTIARSFCIKKRRKGKFAPSQLESFDELSAREAGSIESSQPDPEQAVETAEVWKQVQAGIEKLEPDLREVLILRDIEGLTAKEVSEVVGVSASAVKSRLHRARVGLRSTLSPQAYVPKAGCPNIRELFSKHLEGEIDSEICSTMQEHVNDCPDCAAECLGLRTALNACSTAPCEVPQHVQEQVQQAIRSAIKTSS